MNTFHFRLNGGYTITLDEEALTIEVKGKKGLIKRVKPRTKTIPYDQIIRIDYKKAGITIGYIRFVTPKIDPYPSSLYVAEIDENALIFESDELEQFNLLMQAINKKLPHIKKDVKKV